MRNDHDTLICWYSWVYFNVLTELLTYPRVVDHWPYACYHQHFNYCNYTYSFLSAFILDICTSALLQYIWDLKIPFSYKKQLNPSNNTNMSMFSEARRRTRFRRAYFDGCEFHRQRGPDVGEGCFICPKRARRTGTYRPKPHTRHRRLPVVRRACFRRQTRSCSGSPALRSCQRFGPGTCNGRKVDICSETGINTNADGIMTYCAKFRWPHPLLIF